MNPIELTLSTLTLATTVGLFVTVTRLKRR